MFVLAVKITAGWTKTGPGKPLPEGCAIQRRYRRGSFGGRRFLEAPPCGILAGDAQGFLRRLESFEMDATRGAGRAVPLAVLIHPLSE